MESEIKPARGAGATGMQAENTDAERQKIAAAQPAAAGLFFELSQDLLGVADSAGRLLHINPAWEKKLGWLPTEAEARPFLDWVHPEDQLAAISEIRKVVPGRQAGRFEIRCLGRDGACYRVEWSATADPGRALVYLSGRLVTTNWQVLHAESERRLQAGAVVLRDTEEQFRLLVWSVQDYAIIMLDLEGHAVTWNQGAERLTGYSAADMLGQSCVRLHTAEALRQGVAEWELREVEEKGRCEEEGWRVRRDGSEFWAKTVLTLARDEAGQRRGFSLVMQDLTPRKQAEDALQHSVENLRRSNAELQDFAFVASHDLQEPLRKIQAFSERLTTKCAAQLGAEGQDYLQRMRNAAQRMSTLIEDLLMFSRVTTQARPFARVDLNELARGVVEDLEARLQQTGGEVKIQDLPVIEADPTQMRQLLQNLIGNALKFHRPGESPLVRVFARGLEAESGARRTWSRGRENELCQIFVQDNGIGFDEKYLDRIFTIFQRLNERSLYAGSGIGLAICRKIVERHGGSITARSQPGGGSTFIVNLPNRQAEPESNL
jgi:PAS domain S-box-containing protein